MHKTFEDIINNPIEKNIESSELLISPNTDAYTNQENMAESIMQNA
jgi:hypothetical protein